MKAQTDEVRGLTRMEIHGFSRTKVIEMKKIEWGTVVLSESEYEYMVAELHVGDPFITIR
ncbi:hypothetical protein ACKUFS_10535 [Pseudomonas cannabina]|uniref:Uncharacterized protein n=2 Tax=Pseudomonas syringae group TaxID=136849 RepID=A0A8T8C0V3_PSEYM|nr:MULTISPECIES: hypothetical protein [Pseudomonas syringae group]QHE97016.1 hypothetical protein PMA4326_010545 [Pseudomonas syringae pv. maculicola str. ES4326]QQN19939.1 hypothetical protein JGS08_14915 [Pseudomonas cannabina pv. alisalensis]RMN84706.1 hypothetical protein ALQ53_200016 [Pseudomonas cannabina]UBY97672.1 hypothetical protein LCG56_00445 [Pseudomonas cannabina pv. alisalensis]